MIRPLELFPVVYLAAALFFACMGVGEYLDRHHHARTVPTRIQENASDSLAKCRPDPNNSSSTGWSSVQ